MLYCDSCFGLTCPHSTHRNLTESPLLHLPAGLRSKIYAYAIDGYKIRVSRDHPEIHLLLSLTEPILTLDIFTFSTGIVTVISKFNI